MKDKQIFRREHTVYVWRGDVPCVLFHISEPSSYHLQSVDKLIELALAITDQAPPARMFFKSEEDGQ